MFQFPALASLPRSDTLVCQCGLSHSEIHGSKVICTSPWLIAAYHVLLRLREPRHPPDALTYFLCRFISSSYFQTLSIHLSKKHWRVFKSYLQSCMSICQRSIVTLNVFQHYGTEVENNGFEPLTFVYQQESQPTKQYTLYICSISSFSYYTDLRSTRKR